jgi:hypothetical protein
MFEATQDGLGKNAPVHSIHGSLLAVGELLRLIEFSSFALLICRCFINYSKPAFLNLDKFCPLIVSIIICFFTTHTHTLTKSAGLEVVAWFV